MNTFRYAIAVMLIVAIPAAISYWLLIHPFVGFWRRLGTRVSYSVICALLAVIMTGMFLLRGCLLAVAWGFSPLLSLIGLGCLLVSLWLKLKLSKELSLRVMLGVPELTPDPSGSRMISQGIYTRIRHPRYLQMDMALTGFALFANYPATYDFLVLWYVGIFMVVLLEERELLARFGNDYREYCRRVPRFIPRIKPGKGSANDAGSP